MREKLPLGARVVKLADYEPSSELARRLADAGASDIAIDAAGGPGTAAGLRRDEHAPPAPGIRNGAVDPTPR